MLQRGPKSVPIRPVLGEIRSITRDELHLLNEKRPVTSAVQKLRDSHHRVARCIAAGMKNIEISSVCGISQSRISVLKSDPAFQELVASYRDSIDAAFIRQQDHFMELATSNMLKAESMLADKIDAAIENEEFLPTRDLLAISRDAADRFGYGKKNLNVNVNVDFAAKLEEARRRSARVVELRPTPIGPTPAQSAPVVNSAPASQPQEPSPFRRRV